MNSTTGARTPILPCQAMFGIEIGQQIVAHIEGLTGQPCPCRRGHFCPLAGPAIAEVEPLRDTA